MLSQHALGFIEKRNTANLAQAISVFKVQTESRIQKEYLAGLVGKFNQLILYAHRRWETCGPGIDP